MKGSFRLGSLAGIDFKLHFTFPLILLMGALQWSSPHGLAGAAFGVLLMLALFVCVALHELGHALAARGFGIPVREIVLLPIGGVALLERNPRRPLHELVIAVAGPLVNVVIAVGLILFLGKGGGFPADPEALVRATQEGLTLATLLHWLLVANLSLVLFNLIPAFPMDGGRMLRAVMAMFLGFRQATRVATGVGQVLAVGLGLWGLMQGQIMLALVAVFVFLGAGQERAAEEARTLLSSLVLGDAYNKHALTLAPADRVDRVVDYLLTSYQPDFAVLHGGHLLGVVTKERVLRSMVTGEGNGYVTSIMDREVARFPPHLSLAEVQERMEEASVSVAAVFENDRFLGLVNLDDLREALQIAAFQQVAGRDREDLHAA